MTFRGTIAGLATAGLLAGGVAAGPAGSAGADAAAIDDPTLATGPVAPLGADGAWFVDAEGRVVLMHGVNEVYKSAPFYPAADGFGADDAAFLAEHGFNVVRLGVEFQGVMPEAGEIDHDYIEALAGTVDQLAEQGIFVLLDFHQDGYGPEYTGNGFPEWMSIDDGEFNNPDTGFPLYYIENPALQRAFQNFWANRVAEDGAGLQDHFVNGLTAVVERFASQPYVVGYELMNEPWPGHVWEPCIDPAGCTQLEQELLVPFYEKATAAVREISSSQQVWVEPFVLFNFGQAPTSLPGAGQDNVLSWHSYALDVAGEEAVADFARAAAERDRTPAAATEFGATMDVEVLNRVTGQIEDGLMSWMFWAYNENIVTDRSRPASLDQVRDIDTFTALVRPYPTAVTGTPTSSSFDPATGVYRLTYDTAGPSGQEYPDGVPTTLSVPSLQYPEGYTVELTGATVGSEDDAEVLTLENEPGAESVSVCLLPRDGSAVPEDCADDPGDDPGSGNRPDPDRQVTGPTSPPAIPVRGAPPFTG